MKTKVLTLAIVLVLSTFIHFLDAQTGGKKKQLGPVSGAEQKPVKNGPIKNGPVTFKFEKGFDHSAVAIELSPDGKVLATGGLDKDVRIYSTEDWTELAKSDAPEGLVLDLLFSDDGKYLVSCGEPKQVLVFDAHDLNVLQNYKIQFRPERIAESSDQRIAVVGRSGRQAMAGLSEKWSSNGVRIHKSFIGGAASAQSPKVVYTAGDQQSGGFVLSRKASKIQKITTLPGRPARVSMGRNDREVLVTTPTKAVVIDVVRKRTLETWEIPDAKKVEDIIYWAAQDIYVTSDKSGFVRLWMRGHDKPIAQHKISNFDVYQVLAIDDNRLAFCGRESTPRSITIWNLSFDKSKMPKPKIAAKLAENSDGSSSEAKDMPELNTPKELAENSNADPDGKTEKKATKSTTKKFPTRAPATFVALNDDFEVKRISPADLQLRNGIPTTKAELEWEINQLEAAKKPIPKSLVEFEPLEIIDAIVSPGKGTLFLATSEGLVSYEDGKAKLIRTKDNQTLKAKCLARDPVDGILIGEDGGYGVYELRESGKLVNRGKTAPEDPSDDKDKDNKSVNRIVMSGSDYLALASSTVYRRLPEGDWIKEDLKTDNPITDFALLATGEIATAEQRSSAIAVHRENAEPLKIRMTRATEDRSDPLAKSSSLVTSKIIAGEDGDLFCVFAKKRTQSVRSTQRSSSSQQPVTCGCGNLYGSMLNDTFTHLDLNWDIVKPYRGSRAVVDFHPGPSKRTGDLWFITPSGMGRIRNGKAEFWDTQFAMEGENVELSQIRALGDGSYMVFTSDGIHSQDAFLVRPTKRE